MLHGLTQRLIVLVLMLFQCAAVAQTSGDNLRPATPEDLTGIWKQVAGLPLNPIVDMSNAWYSGVQYYSFPAPGKMKVMLLEGKQTDLDDKMMSIWNIAPAGWSYELLPQGGAMLKHVDTPAQFVRLLVVTSEPSPNSSFRKMMEQYPQFSPRRGDLVIAYFMPDLKPRFLRLLRHHATAR